MEYLIIYFIQVNILSEEESIIVKELNYSTLYDHYKETVSYLKSDLEKRDRLTLLVFIFFIIHFIAEIKPTHSVTLANSWVKDKFGVTLGLNYSLISTAILLLLLWNLIKYFQMCLNIEKQYNYIHKIEDKLNCLSGEELITREGHHYLNQYPLLSAVIHRIYNFFLPTGIIFSIVLKMFLIPLKDFGILSMANIFIQLLIILICFLYLLFVYRDVTFVNKLNEQIKEVFIKIYLYKED